jgi:hypothetical protein
VIVADALAGLVDQGEQAPATGLFRPAIKNQMAVATYNMSFLCV